MKLLLTCLLIFTSMGFAFANDTASTAPARDTYYSSGYFAGLNLGQGRVDVPNIPDFTRKHRNFFGHVYIGYNLNHYFGFQIGYLMLPKAKYKNGGTSDIDLKSDGFSGLLKAKYPIGEGFALYGDIGGAILSSSQEQTGFAKVNQNATVLAYGGGIDYAFANIGGLHTIIDYLHTHDKNTKTLNIPAYDLVAFGVYYQF